MKKTIGCLTILLSCMVHAQKASIQFDVNRVIGNIDPKIYGVFMEPIHLNGKRMGLPDSVEINTLYGTLYDPASPLADENGFRKDYIDAMKELKVTNMRWPGGNFLMGYNWEDGIGPKDKRPVRINLAWGGLENNQVGTDEWFKLNKSMNSENILCANLGLGTIIEAAHWVEYCNYKGGTYYSDLRARNGHKAPYNVKIWDLGNEVDGKPWELGHKNAEDYIEIAREAAKAMKAVDDSIEFVGCGSSWYSNSGWDEWNRKVLTGLGDKIKYLSIHSYWESDADYYGYMGGSAKIFDDRITITAGEIKAVSTTQGYKHPIYLSVDEWGAFGRNFMNILPIAQSFNSFIRHADVVKMANFTLMTSLLSNDPQKGNFKSPLFYTFQLFSNNCLGQSVDTYVSCDTFNTANYEGLGYLDATTTFSKDRNTVFINVVNRHKDKAINADISGTSGIMEGNATATVISTNDLQEPFSYAKKDQYLPVKQNIAAKNKQLSYSFPPHSFTQIQLTVKGK